MTSEASNVDQINGGDEDSLAIRPRGRTRTEPDRTEKDRDNANGQKASGSDVLTLDIGGEKTVKTLRSTLTYVAGSKLAEMFSGRWDHSLPKNERGDFFIDREPAFFLLLLKYMRDISSIPSCDTTEHDVPLSPITPSFTEKSDEITFRRMVDAFGLTKILYNYEVYKRNRSQLEGADESDAESSVARRTRSKASHCSEISDIESLSSRALSHGTRNSRARKKAARNTKKRLSAIPEDSAKPGSTEPPDVVGFTAYGSPSDEPWEAALASTDQPAARTDSGDKPARSTQMETEKDASPNANPKDESGDDSQPPVVAKGTSAEQSDAAQALVNMDRLALTTDATTMVKATPTETEMVAASVASLPSDGASPDGLTTDNGNKPVESDTMSMEEETASPILDQALPSKTRKGGRPVGVTAKRDEQKNPGTCPFASDGMPSALASYQSVPPATFIDVGDMFGCLKPRCDKPQPYTVLDMNVNVLICGDSNKQLHNFRPSNRLYTLIELYHCTRECYDRQEQSFTADNLITDKHDGSSPIDILCPGDVDFEMKDYCLLSALPIYYYSEIRLGKQNGLVCFACEEPFPLISSEYGDSLYEAWTRIEADVLAYCCKDDILRANNVSVANGAAALTALANNTQGESQADKHESSESEDPNVKDRADKACKCVQRHWKEKHTDAHINVRTNVNYKLESTLSLVQYILYTSWRSNPLTLDLFYDCYCRFDFTKLTTRIAIIFGACPLITTKKNGKLAKIAWTSSVTSATRNMRRLLSDAFYNFDWSKLFYCLAPDVPEFETTKVLRIWQMTNEFFATGLWWKDCCPMLHGIELDDSKVEYNSN